MKILVVDLEATCLLYGTAPTPTGNQSAKMMEVIEVGCALAEPDGTLLEARSFFVCPSEHPILTDFCTELTGITQAEVDQAPGFADVCKEIDGWLSNQVKDLSCWGS